MTYNNSRQEMNKISPYEDFGVNVLKQVLNPQLFDCAKLLQHPRAWFFDAQQFERGEGMIVK